MRFVKWFIVTAASMIMIGAVSLSAESSRGGDMKNYQVQPCGHINGAAITWTAGRWTSVSRSGRPVVSVGIDVADTSSGGNLVVHLINDYNAAGSPVLCTLTIPAGTTAISRYGWCFDRIDSAGTTIKLGGVTILQ
jgi:hypothetical protein